MIRKFFPVLYVSGTHRQKKFLQGGRERVIITVHQRDLLNSTFLGV